MTYSNWQSQTEADRYDMWVNVGPPCLNCETEPAEKGGFFCSDECKAESEGTDENADDASRHPEAK